MLKKPEPPPAPVLKKPDEGVSVLLKNPAPVISSSGTRTGPSDPATLIGSDMPGPPTVALNKVSDEVMVRSGTVMGPTE